MKSELNKKNNKFAQIKACEEIFDILKFDGSRSTIEAIIRTTAFENSYINLSSIQ